MLEADSTAPPVRVIGPQTGWRLPDLRELRDYSDLIYMLVRRDLQVRYRQTAVGLLWAILQPVALAAVFGLFLGALAKVPSRADLPYPLYVYSGMVVWLYVQQALTKASESTVESGPLISKVWFPRIIVPLVAVISPLADLAAGLVVLLIAMVLYGHPPGPELLALPLAVLLAVATALGLGLWLSAVHVRFRDVKHLVPFLTLVGLFVTPVTYPFSIVPHAVQPLYALNPLVGVLELYRWTLFGRLAGGWWLPVIPLVAALVLLATGAVYFNRAERDFADHV